jgi:hypothetical protein
MHCRQWVDVGEIIVIFLKSESFLRLFSLFRENFCQKEPENPKIIDFAMKFKIGN